GKFDWSRAYIDRESTFYRNVFNGFSEGFSTYEPYG
ncbi:unnamed protein product, partial [marine sediment metagenome]